MAIDVGGTTVKAAALADDGRVVVETPVPTGRGAAAVATVRALARRLADAVGDHRVRSVGVAVPGLVDGTSGTVRYAANLDWRDVRLGDVLRRDLQALVRVEHDARAGALAHVADGSFGPTASFVFVPIGTGVSAGVVVAGQVVDGAAGEFGHVPAVPGGEPCTCGARGCVEAYASAHSLLRRYRASVPTSPPDLTAADVVARTGVDPVADRVWAEGVDALASGLIAVTALLDPDAVLLGGGVSRAGDELLRPLSRSLRVRMPWRPAPALRISPHLDRAPLTGAAALALRGVVNPSDAAEHLRRLSAHLARPTRPPTERVSTSP
nr:ROK family protein [Kineococcus aurantiacus]